MPKGKIGAQIVNSILETVGNTPIIRLNNIAPDHVEIFVKSEAFNPGGSIKDRLAVSIIESAERDGSLKPGQTVVEATSGNTGIGLAMVCAAKGYPFIATMHDGYSVERRKLMRFFGAKVVLTPKEEKGIGMYNKAKELAQKNGWFLARQIETEANADIHAETTAQEIISGFEDRRLDYFFTGYGTGGTVTGIGRALKKTRPAIRVMLTEPANAPVVASGRPTPRNEDGSPTESHEAFEPHPIQGVTPDFVPLVLQKAIDGSYFERVVPVSGPVAIETTKLLAKKEGIFVGISSGAALAGALDVAKDAAPGTVMLVMLPDTGERYLSSPLFEGIPEDMSDEEAELAWS